MDLTTGENSGFPQGRRMLLLKLAAVIFCFSISLPYFMGILSLEVVLALSVLPFFVWLFLTHQEVALLALIAARFGVGYFIPDVVTQGLIRGLFLLAIGFVLLLRTGVKKSVSRISTPLDKWVILWLGVILVSFIYGFYFRDNNMRYLLGDLYKFLEIISIFWLTTLITKDSKQIRFLIWGFLIVALMFGIIDSVIFFSRFRALGDVLGARVREAAQFSSIFALVLTASLVLYEQKRRIRIILAFLGFVFLASFALTFFRTGYIALPSALVFIFFLYFYKHRKRFLPYARKFAVLILFLLVFVGLVSGIFTLVNIDIIKETATRFYSMSDISLLTSAQIRISEAESIISGGVAQNPLLGGGLGAEYSAPRLQGSGDRATSIIWERRHYVHNNYLEVLFRTGILGLLIFLLLAFKYLKDAIKFYLRSKNWLYQGILLGAIGIFISSGILALSTNMLYSPLLFMMIAVTYCTASLEEKACLKAKKNE